MFYRRYMTQKERDEIATGSYGDSESYPHCNMSTFHEPKTCAFCDGYYNRHPGFAPSEYSTPEANGWGGNMAPIVDDEKAEEEERELVSLMERMIRSVAPRKVRQG